MKCTICKKSPKAFQPYFDKKTGELIFDVCSNCYKKGKRKGGEKHD